MEVWCCLPACYFGWWAEFLTCVLYWVVNCLNIMRQKSSVLLWRVNLLQCYSWQGLKLVTLVLKCMYYCLITISSINRLLNPCSWSFSTFSGFMLSRSVMVSHSSLLPWNSSFQVFYHFSLTTVSVVSFQLMSCSHFGCLCSVLCAHSRVSCFLCPLMPSLEVVLHQSSLICQFEMPVCKVMSGHHFSVVKFQLCSWVHSFPSS